jgi:ribonuclease HI
MPHDRWLQEFSLIKCHRERLSMPLRTIPTSALARRSVAGQLNEVIDHYLLDATEQHLDACRRLCRMHNVTALAERARRRATVLSKTNSAHAAHILRARDTLILQIYAETAPKGSFCGWCDASSIEYRGQRAAALGGLLLDPRQRLVARVARIIGRSAAFEAEIAACEALLQTALRHGAERIRVHTDCSALVSLWCAKRHDPRLLKLLTLARRFRHVDLRRIPRLHNQSANRLARTVALRRLGAAAAKKTATH